MRRLVAFACLVLSVVPGVASGSEKPPSSYLGRLEGMRSSGEAGLQKETSLRAKSIREAASSLGSRAGLAWETERIDRSLDKEAGILDRMFDFSGLLLDDGRVIPPVVLSTRGAVRMDSPLLIQRSLVSWHILHPAVLATVPPNWRLYLYRHYDEPDTGKIPGILLPKSRNERKEWREGVSRGFSIGVRQAKEIFKISLRRLRTDFLGMVRFHALAVRNVVSIPVYSHTDLGVVRSKDRVDAGVRIYRIQVPSGFTPEGSWKAPGIMDSGKENR